MSQQLDPLFDKDAQERYQQLGEDDVPQDVLDAIAVSLLFARARVKYLGVEPHRGGVLVTMLPNAPDPLYVIHQRLHPAMTDDARWDVLHSVKDGTDYYWLTRK